MELILSRNMVYKPNKVYEIEYFEPTYINILKKKQKKLTREYNENIVSKRLENKPFLYRSLIRRPLLWLLISSAIWIFITFSILKVLKASEVSFETLKLSTMGFTILWQISIIVQTTIVDRFKSSPSGIYRFYWIAEQLLEEYREKGYSIHSLKNGIDRYIEKKRSYMISFGSLLSYFVLYLSIDNLGFSTGTKALDLISDILFPFGTFPSDRWQFFLFYAVFCVLVFFNSYIPQSWAKQVKNYIEFIENEAEQD